MKPVYWPVALNLVGMAAAFLYAVGGGSGGETTEGVFMLLWATGWLSVLLASVVLVRLLLQKRAGVNEVAILVVIAAVGFLETRLVVSDAMALRVLLG